MADGTTTATATADGQTPPPATTAGPTATTVTGITTTADPTKTVETKVEETKPKAPASYDLKVSDTAKPLLSDKDLAYLKDIAKASDWTNEEAQAELDATITRAQDRIQAQSEAWLTETKADTTYGGAKLEESQRLAQAVVNRLRPEGHPRRESFLRFLNTGGAGNHIEVVSFLADLGKQMAEDQPGHMQSSERTPQSVADKLYPTTAKV